MQHTINDDAHGVGQAEDINASIECDEPQNENPLALSSEEQEVKELHRQLIGFGHKALELAIEIGDKLQILKERQGHGKWGGYVEGTLGIQPRTASNYLRLAENQETLRKSERFTDLNPTDALEEIRRLKKTEAAGNDDSEMLVEEDFILADGRSLKPKKLVWRTGLFERSRIDSALERISKTQDGKEDPKKAIQQQVFLYLASSINASCESPPSGNVASVVRQALKEIGVLLDELDESSSSESAAG